MGNAALGLNGPGSNWTTVDRAISGQGLKAQLESKNNFLMDKSWVNSGQTMGFLWTAPKTVDRAISSLSQTQTQI